MLRKKNSEPAQLPEARQELLGFESPAVQPGKKDPKQFLKHNWKKITAVVCVAAVGAAVLLPKTSKKDVQASTQYVEAARNGAISPTPSAVPEPFPQPIPIRSSRW